MRILRALIAVLIGGGILLLPSTPAAAVDDCDAQIVDTTNNKVITNNPAVTAQAKRLVNLGAVVRVRALQHEPGLTDWVTNQMWACGSWRNPQALPGDRDPGRQNLVVVAISVGDNQDGRAIELYTGTDYSDQISQDAADKIRIDYMAPRLRAAAETGQTDQYAAGVATGLQAVADIIDPNVESELEPVSLGTIFGWTVVIVVGLSVVIFAVVMFCIKFNRRRKRLAAQQAAIAAKQKASALFMPLSDAEQDELFGLRMAITALTDKLGTKGSDGLQKKATAIAADLRKWLNTYSAYTTGNSQADTPLADLYVAATDKTKPHDPELPATAEEYQLMAQMFDEITAGLEAAETDRRNVLKVCEHYRIQCGNLANLMDIAAKQVKYAKSEIARRHTGAYRYKTDEAEAELIKAKQHLAEAREDHTANHRLSAMLNTQKATRAALAAFDMAAELPVRHQGLKQELDELTAKIGDTRSYLHSAQNLLNSMTHAYVPALLTEAQEQLAAAQQTTNNLPGLLSQAQQCLAVEQQDWDGAQAHLQNAHNAVEQVITARRSIEHTHNVLAAQLEKAQELLAQARRTASDVYGLTHGRVHSEPREQATAVSTQADAVAALLQSGEPVDPVAAQQDLHAIIADLRAIRRQSDNLAMPRSTHVRVGGPSRSTSRGFRSRSSGSRSTGRRSSSRRSGRRSGGNF